MTEKMLLLFIAASVVLLIAFVVYIKRPKKLKKVQFVAKWRELQRHCADKKNWPDALKDADVLLDAALKKRRYKGKTMGARLMAAQRQIKNNDSIWVAHNLTKKMVELIKAGNTVKLSKTEVKESLQSYQEALTDLGALRRAEPKE